MTVYFPPTTLLPCRLVGFNCHKLAPQGYIQGKIWLINWHLKHNYATKIKIMVFEDE